MVGIAQLHPAVDEPVSEYWPVYTIGHSTRTIPEFVGLLQIAAVDLVVDIRSVPRSRTNPQYKARASELYGVLWRWCTLRIGAR